jgi:hypothetical protein
MITRRVRGRPFKPGNPGRPPGSKNKITQIVEQLAEGQAEQLVQKVIELPARRCRELLVRPQCAAGIRRPRPDWAAVRAAPGQGLMMQLLWERSRSTAACSVNWRVCGHDSGPTR